MGKKQVFIHHTDTNQTIENSKKIYCVPLSTALIRCKNFPEPGKNKCQQKIETTPDCQIGKSLFCNSVFSQ